jgi:hypothetical protein
MTGTWSSQLAEAVATQLSRRATAVTVHSIRPVSDHVLEIVFSVRGDDDLRGIRVERTVIESSDGRVMQSSLDEIAFDVVAMGICEPRRLEEFCEADTAGVRWLPLSDWLEDIS